MNKKSKSSNQPKKVKNPKTAKTTKRAKTAQKENDTFHISGRVFNQQTNKGIAGLQVEVFDKDMREEQRLGKATTDEQGYYEISYTADQFSSAEQKSADIIVRVSNAEGMVVATSEVVFNAPPEQTIDLSIEFPPQPAVSEYEQLLAELTLLLKDVPLVDLNDEDVEFLAGEMGIEPQRIELLREATKLSNQITLPTEVYYGFLRQDLPASLQELLTQPSEALRQALNTALEKNNIPPALSNSIDVYVQQLERLQGIYVPLKDLATTIGIKPNDPLLDQLNSQNINTLDDIRRLGGLGNIEFKATYSEKDVRLLESHADLQSLGAGVSTSAKLIDAGYSSVIDISLVPYERFVEDLKGSIGLENAERLHATAMIEAGSKSIKLLNTLTERGRGVLINSVFQEEEKCECRDCESAVNPRAYLEALAHYAEERLRYRDSHDPKGRPVSINFLSNLFHQPFSGQTLDSCSAGAAEVSQSRLCIEVLRRFADEEGIFPSDIEIEFVLAGDVDGDGRDELVVYPSLFKGELRQRLMPNGFWVMKYDYKAKTWSHLSGGDLTSGLADVVCNNNLDMSVRFALLADVDGDQRKELVVYANDLKDLHSSFWVMDFDPSSNRWNHLSPIDNHILDADVICSTAAIRAKMAIAADINGDKREELIVAPDISGLQGNKLWALSYDPNASQWNHIGGLTGDPIGADLRCSSAPYAARFISAGDIDGDGVTELLVGSDGSGGAGNGIWVMKYFPLTKSWAHITSSQQVFDFDFIVSARPLPVVFALADDINGDGRAEIIVAPDSSSDPDPILLVFAYEWQQMDPVIGGGNWTFNKVTSIDLSSAKIKLDSFIIADIDADKKRELVAIPAFDDRTPEGHGLWAVRKNPQRKDWEHISLLPDNPYTLDVTWPGIVNPARMVVAADVNGDGKKELAVLTRYNVGLSFFMLDFDPSSATWQIYRAATIGDDSDYCQAAYKDLLVELGTSFEELRISRGAAGEDRRALAERLKLPWKTDSNPLDELYFAPGTVTEEDLMQIFGLQSTKTVAFPPESKICQWQLEYLRQKWALNDRPQDVYNFNFEPTEERFPIIDPDIIIPDDFRNTTPKLSATDDDTAFDLWIARRKWVDNLLSESKVKRTQDSIESAIEWALGAGSLAVLEQYRVALRNPADPQGQQQARHDILSQFGLSLESFSRLLSLREKNITHIHDQSKPVLTDGELNEIDSILVQARKRSLFNQWIEEETAIKLSFGPDTFWHSVRNPRVGAWPPVIDQDKPLIDPNQIGLQELPEPYVGFVAIQLWKDRLDKLDSKFQELHKTFESEGFESMLKMALGHPNPGDDLQYDIDQIKNNLDAADLTLVAEAKRTIEDDLYLTVDQFNQILEMRNAILNSVPITDQDEQEIFRFLIEAYKHKHLYNDWINEEDQAGLRQEYWRALKARLPEWISDSSQRQLWLSALARRSTMPIIEPDILQMTDFVLKITPNPAYELWMNRRTWISDTVEKNLRNVFEQEANLLDKFNALVRTGLEIDPMHLTRITEEQQHGEDVTASLEQLDLKNAAFSRLMAIHDLITKSEPIEESEWNEIFAILISAVKVRQYGKWQKEEANIVSNHQFIGPLTLGPDYFHIPAADPLDFPPSLGWQPEIWRSTRQERLDWEDKLLSRIEQRDAILRRLDEMIRNVEAKQIPKLRDKLIRAINTIQGVTLAERARWVNNRFLIDAQAGGCQRTTRIAQAIATLQGILWSVRAGHMRDIYPSLILDSSGFDEEWQWMGSYATWRSVIFISLYPENLLLPSLLPIKTPAFQTLLKQLRSGRVTPEIAKELVANYAKYFLDVASIRLEAEAGLEGNNIRVFCFGRPTADPGKPSPLYGLILDWQHYDSLWISLPGGEYVETVHGAVPYVRDGEDQWIYVFFTAIQQYRRVLRFIRYSDRRRDWEQPIDLDIPDGVEPFEVRVLDRDKGQPPKLGIITPAATYLCNLNVAGNAWSKEGPQRIVFCEWRDLKRDEVWPGWDSSWDGTPSLERLRGVFEYLEKNNPGFKAAFPNGHFAQNAAGEKVYGHWLLTEHAVEERWIPQSSIQSDAINLNLDLNNIVSRGVYHIHNGDLRTWLRLSHIVAKLPHLHGGKSFRGGIPTGIKNQDDQWRFFFIKDVAADEISVNLKGITNLRLQFTRTSDLLASSYDRPGFPTFHLSGSGIAAIMMRPEGYASAALPASVRQPRYTTPFLNADISIGQLFEPPTTQSFSARQWITKTAVNDAENNDNRFYVTCPRRYYFEEALFHVPLAVALSLQIRGEFVAALDWYRLLYDYTLPIRQSSAEDRESYPWASAGTTTHPFGDITFDPLNPHYLAHSKPDGYLRFLILNIVRCLLDYANVEFTRDTAESVPHARMLYEEAIKLLSVPELKEEIGRCEADIAAFTSDIAQTDASLVAIIRALLRRLDKRSSVKRAIAALKYALEVDKERDPVKLAIIVETVNNAASDGNIPLSSDWFDDISINRARIGLALADNRITSGISNSERASGNVTNKSLTNQMTGDEILPRLKTNRMTSLLPLFAENAMAFCIPPNPVLRALRLHAELNLQKIRTCRNIEGLQRRLELYASFTESLSGIPWIGSTGAMPQPAFVPPRSTVYRYSYLIERARQQAQLASQVESAMLASIERSEAETYNRLKANQDFAIARAGIRLQQLRLKEAERSVRLADLTKRKSEFQAQHYEDLISARYSGWEWAALTLMAGLAEGYGFAAIRYFIATDEEKGWEYTAKAAEEGVRISQTIASYERRKQEWEFNRDLAKYDIQIGQEQLWMALDREQIVLQEGAIADLQATHAETVLSFLSEKFTNAELYDWMSQVLGEAYSKILQYATATARLAEQQLAFERHEPAQQIIATDYWQPPNEGMSENSTNAPDRRGITGSVRLMSDLAQLEQYAVDTTKRKLQLTKTISLAHQFPVEFQLFKQSGKLPFRTREEWFDWDFPGHYLRLIRSVRVSVIALIPPNQGIRASLTSLGLSRLVVGDTMFDVDIIRLAPERIALTSPNNTTGLLELEPQSEMLMPFEGLGVDNFWEFEMSRASNPIDYESLADVIFSIDYTALHNEDYRLQVINRLPTRLSSDRVFSFRNNFADAWYELNNPIQSKTPMQVSFSTFKTDFPSNLLLPNIQHLTLFVVQTKETELPVKVAQLLFIPDSGKTVEADPVQTSAAGFLSTRTGSWLELIDGVSGVEGQWILKFEDTPNLRERFASGQITDIIFVITASGQIPPWPKIVG